MPPPHMHPRSRMTSSLFATTVFASFFVVALPHVLPCPAPRVKLADGGRASAAVCGDGSGTTDEDLTSLAAAAQAPTRRRRRRRPLAEDEEETGETTVAATGTTTTTTAAARTDGFRGSRHGVITEVQRGDGGIARFAMVQTDSVEAGDSDGGGRTGGFAAAAAAQTATQRTPRACPVPKPGGIVGELLGFTKSSSSGGGGVDKKPDRPS